MKKAIFFTESCGIDKENEFESCRGEGRISINTAFGFSLLGYECYIVGNWNITSPKKIWENVYITNKVNENEIYDIAFSWNIELLKNRNNYKYKILSGYADTPRFLKMIKKENLDIILTCNIPCMMHDPTHFNYKNTQYLPALYPIPSINIGFLQYKFEPNLPELKVMLYHSSWESTIPRSQYYIHKQQLILDILNQRYKTNLYILVSNEKVSKECSQIYNLTNCNKVHYVNNEKIRYDDIINLILNVDLCLSVGGNSVPGPIIPDILSLGKPMIYVVEGFPSTTEFNNSDLCKCAEYSIISSETDDISIRKIETSLSDLETSFNCYRKSLEDYDFKNWKKYVENFLIKNCEHGANMNDKINNNDKISNNAKINNNDRTNDNNIEIIGITTCGTYPSWTSYTVASFYNHVDKIIVVNAGYDIENPESGAIHPLLRDHKQLKELDVDNKIIEYTPIQDDINRLFKTSCIKEKDEYGRSTSMTLATQLAYKSFTIPNSKNNWILKLDNDQILYQINRNQLTDIIKKYPNKTGFRFAQYADYTHDFEHLAGTSLPDEFTNDGALFYRANLNQSYGGQGSPSRINVDQYPIYNIRTSHMRRIAPPDVDKYEYFFKRYWYHTFGPNSINEHSYNRINGKKLTLSEISKIANDEALATINQNVIHINDIPKDERIPYFPPLVCRMTPLEYIKKEIDMTINKFGDRIDWEQHIDEIINNETEIYYGKEYNQEKLNKIKKYKKYGKLLDCGCHIGRWIEVFRENGYDYNGIDQSYKAIETAKKYKPDGKFAHNLLWNMSYYEEFDIVHTNAVLQHNTLEEQEKILPKIHKALKHDGILVITESTELKQTLTQRTYQGWIMFIEKHGFKFMESWHKNDVGLEDNYIFIKSEIPINNEKLDSETYIFNEKSNKNVTKEKLIELLKNNPSEQKNSNDINMLSVYDVETTLNKDKFNFKSNWNASLTIQGNTKKLSYPEIDITTNSSTLDNIPSLHNRIKMDKWWNSYLAIPNRVELNGHGADYSNLNDISSSGLVYYVEEFCNNVPVKQYPKVLDIGAGNGGETKLLIDKGYNVTGITLGIDNVKMAKELYNIDILNIDMNRLDFSINSFDAVMMIQTFEHFLSPFIACIELWRVLKINGLCYLDVPCPKDLPMWSINHTNLLYADQIINMFSMCGFNLTKQLSKKNEHRIRLIFKKLSISKIKNWKQLRYIHQLRNEA